MVNDSSTFIVMHFGTQQSWISEGKTTLSRFLSGIIHSKMTSQSFVQSRFSTFICFSPRKFVTKGYPLRGRPAKVNTESTVASQLFTAHEALNHNLPVLILESWLCSGWPVLTVVCGAIWICAPADICKERWRLYIWLAQLTSITFTNSVSTNFTQTLILTN